MGTGAIVLLIIVYLAHTALFAIRLNSTQSGFTKPQKRIHNILFWLLPFVWIFILKNISKPLTSKKTDSGQFYESKIAFIQNSLD